MKKYILSLLLMLPIFAIAQQEVFDKFASEVKTINIEKEELEQVINLTKTALQERQLTQSQFFVVVDANEKKQNAYLAYFDAESQNLNLSPVAAKVSTGSKRSGHFITPVGWFENLPEYGSHRAEGTKNSNGIRGLGIKGMRVWDFGWQKAQAGWKNNEDIRDIRFQMHATDPSGLEARLGKPDSKGCVRVHTTMNIFLDKYGILDKKYEEKGSWVLHKDRQPVNNAGSLLLVINTSSK